MMTNDKMKAQISSKGGFIAALDQSGGSTPGALRLYGVPDSAYSGDAEMFALMHAFRVRIMTAPAFTGEKIIATILFEGTMDGQVQGEAVPAFLWNKRGVVPFVKVDKGLQPENDGVSLMRPMPELDALLARAATLGVFGTKMPQSSIYLPRRELPPSLRNSSRLPRRSTGMGSCQFLSRKSRSRVRTRPAPRPSSWQNSGAGWMPCRVAVR